MPHIIPNKNLNMSKVEHLKDPIDVFALLGGNKFWSITHFEGRTKFSYLRKIKYY